MSDIKLFQIRNNQVKELEGKSVTIEKSLQSLIEQNLEDFLGIKFLASEYSTGAKHGGRIDTLGIDENNYPVIIEYKKATNQNVINQGLFYLNWLQDHKAEFELLVMNKIGKKVSDSIEWKGMKLICIAGGFTKYDSEAIEQMNRNIELIKYKKYPDLLLFELMNRTQEKIEKPVTNKSIKKGSVKDFLRKADVHLQDRFEALREFVINLGDDVQENELKYYIAFKRIQNFICVEVHPKTNSIMLYLKVDPKTIQLKKGFTRDVSNIGHFGTGNLEIRIRTDQDLEDAKPLILKSYERS